MTGETERDVSDWRLQEGFAMHIAYSKPQSARAALQAPTRLDPPLIETSVSVRAQQRQNHRG